MIKAIATASFVHGSQTLTRGEEADFTPSTFTALAAHGLVREKSEQQVEQVPPRAQRAARTPANKKAAELQNQAVPDAAAAATEALAVTPALPAEKQNDAGAAATGSTDAGQS